MHARKQAWLRLLEDASMVKKINALKLKIKGLGTTEEYAQGRSDEVSWETKEEPQKSKRRDYRYPHLFINVCVFTCVYLCVYECVCMSL